MVENPPWVHGIRSVVVVRIVVDALVVFQLAIIDVHRILDDVLIDGRTSASLSGHVVSHVLADVVDAVVQPCKAIIDLGVASEREVVSLVVVVASRKNAVRVDVAVGSHETCGLASSLDTDGIVCLKSGRIEVLQRILLEREVGE